MAMCGVPCWCHMFSVSCCTTCQPNQTAAAEEPKPAADEALCLGEWGPAEYKEPEDSPLNKKCRCRHPKRNHEGMCMNAACPCMRFAE